MDYLRFVELRVPVCDEFQAGLDKTRRRGVSYPELERLAFLYRQLLHDHALARSRFPGTAVTRRLQRLVLAGTHRLQRDTGENLPSIGRFLSYTFPRAMRRLRSPILLMAGLFLLAALFGFSLTSVEPALGMAFLSPDAVEDLKAGRLWTESVFAVLPGATASSMIATNNLSVALTAWAGGALAGLGALWVVLLNGLMLGAVTATTAHYSMTPSLLEFIAAHGPLELSLIVVSAAAGLRVGQALVTASDQPRAERLRTAGRDALIVLLGCLPWFLVLGLVEGFLSPHPGLPFATKVLLGLTLEAVFVTIAWNPLMPGAEAS